MKHKWTAAALIAGLGVALGNAAGAAAAAQPAAGAVVRAAVPADRAADASATDMVLAPTRGDVLGAGDAAVLPVVYATRALAPGRAASIALSPALTFETGTNLDLVGYFHARDGLPLPLVDESSFLNLANGGHYAGLVYAPLPSLRLRIGAQVENDRLDRFSLDPTRGMNGFSLIYDPGEQRSALAGVSWDFTHWAGLDIDGIVSRQSGMPLGFQPGFVPAGGATTGALDVSAHVDFGGGWVSTARYNSALTQLDPKNGMGATLGNHSYSIAIAKHGLFGDDALGFSFGRPSPGLIDNGFEMLAASGDLPPAFVANSRMPGQKAETDFQLGYVTSFLNGALALQANAAYQMNYQGQAGATAVAVLSRAKIKF